MDEFKKADLSARATTTRGIINRLRESIRTTEVEIESKEKYLADLDKAIKEAK